MAKDVKTIREELWKDVAVGVANSSNSTRVDSAIQWADKILYEFDKRFKRDDPETT